jgi:hypothetical protein
MQLANIVSSYDQCCDRAMAQAASRRPFTLKARVLACVMWVL